MVTLDPRPRIVPRSQGIFVRNRIAAEGADALRLLDEQSQWHRLRGPLAIGIGLVLAFLAITQRDLLNSAVGTIATVGGGVAALTQMLSHLRGGGKPKGDS
jgi:uncharacterized membrane protein HdeD (DUF308 family)